MKPTNSYYDNYAKQSMINALLQLMKEKDLDQISITEICKKADVARRTFYLYYSSKMEVLEDYYRVLTREFDDENNNSQSIAQHDQFDFFFVFWYRHRDFLKLLDKHNIFYFLLNRFNEYLTNRSKFEKVPDHNNYRFIYSSGGLWSVLYKWTKDDFAESPEKLAEIIRSIEKKPGLESSFISLNR